MRNINKVILIGNLTRDAEMKSTINGQHITTFGIATNRSWMTKDFRKQESAEFHEVVCWGRLAEFAQQNLKKGKLVYIQGFLKTRSWDDEGGVKRFRTEIVVEDLIMLDKRPRENAAADSLPAQAEEAVTEASISIEDPITI